MEYPRDPQTSDPLDEAIVRGGAQIPSVEYSLDFQTSDPTAEASVRDAQNPHVEYSRDPQTSDPTVEASAQGAQIPSAEYSLHLQTSDPTAEANFHDVHRSSPDSVLPHSLAPHPLPLSPQQHLRPSLATRTIPVIDRGLPSPPAVTHPAPALLSLLPCYP